MIKNILVFTICLLVLASCADSTGGDYGTGQSLTSEIPAEGEDNSPISPTENTVVSGKIQLGPVVGALIQFMTRDDEPLLSTQSGHQGEYSINKTLLESKINQLPVKPEFIRIIVTGGVDIDPDDDGIVVDHESKPVLGSVSAIIPFDQLFSDQKINVNLITTYIDELTTSVSDLSTTQLNKIAKDLGLADINGDGSVDLNDANVYDMIENDCVAETDLKEEGFLGAIHDGDEIQKREIVKENLKRKSNLLPEISTANGFLSVKLSGISDSGYAQYAIDESLPENITNFYRQENIIVPKDSYVAFRECFPEWGECSDASIIYFDGKSPYEYFPEFFYDYGSEQGLIQEELDDIHKKRNQLESEYSKVNEERVLTEDQLKSIENDLEEQAKKYADITEEIKSLELFNDEVKELLNNNDYGESFDRAVIAAFEKLSR